MKRASRREVEVVSVPEGAATMENNGRGEFGGPGGEAAPRGMPAASNMHAGRTGEGTLRLAPPADILPDPVPIWFAALLAIPCQATAGGSGHTVRWNHVRGRALYTNTGQATELIQPLGVSLERGQTVAVSWNPGETAYKVEVYRPFERCA